MSLESQAHTSTLHARGHDAVKAFSFTYFPDAKPGEERIQIPSSTLFDFSERSATAIPKQVTNADSTATNEFNQLPNVAECAAHLELLQVFYVIRQKILVSTKIDDAMDIHPKRVTKTGKKGDTKTLKDVTFWERRQEKWYCYLEFATIRFLAWSKALTSKDVTARGPGPRIPKVLPPLDILMVWHSFLLNPRLFHDTCGKDLIWKIRFPWEDVHAAIDSDDWSFRLDSQAAASFETNAELPSDLFRSFEDWPPRKSWTSPTIAGAFAEPGRNGSIPLTDFRFSSASWVGPGFSRWPVLKRPE